MTHADASEIAILAAGALILLSFLRREYLSIQDISDVSALANTPRETMRRAVVLAVKVKFSKFIAIDRATLEDYKRFQRIVDLLSFLAAVNVFMLAVIAIGLFMIFNQSSFQSYIRPQDLMLMLGFLTAFIIGSGAIDRLRDTLRERQSNPASVGRVREQPSNKEVFRTLQPQDDTMRKPKTSQSRQDHKIPASLPAGPVYTPLTAHERASLKDNPEAVKQDLIAAGILDNDGQIKAVYKRN